MILYAIANGYNSTVVNVLYCHNILMVLITVYKYYLASLWLWSHRLCSVPLHDGASHGERTAMIINIIHRLASAEYEA